MWHYPFISKNWPWCSRSFLVQPKTFKSVFWCAIEINHSNLSIYGSISEILYNYKDVFIKGRTYKWTGLICLTIFVQEYVHVLVKFCPAAILLIPTSKPTGFLSVTLHDGMYLIKISWVLIIARYGEYLDIPLFHKMTCFVLSLYRALQRRPFISTCTRWVVLERRKKTRTQYPFVNPFNPFRICQAKKRFCRILIIFSIIDLYHNYSVVFPVRCSRELALKWLHFLFMTFCAFIKCNIPMNFNVYLSHVRAEKSLQSLYTFCTVISKHRKYFYNFNIRGTIYFVF